MTYDEAYDISKQNQKDIHTVKLLLCPLIFCVICLIISLFGIRVHIAIKIASCYIYIAYLYSESGELKNPIFHEIEKRRMQNKLFFKSPNIPRFPPLYNGGFVYAKRRYDYEEGEPEYSTYSDPYPVKIDINHDICTIYIDNQKMISKSTYYPSDLFNDALINFEAKGYYVDAIMNRYGDYVWIRGQGKEPSVYDKKPSDNLMALLYFVWFVCQITPIICMIAN